MLRTQVGHNLGNLGISERVGEGRHLATSVENLLRDLVRRPVLILAHVREIGSFFRAYAGDAVAMFAPFIAKENSPGLFIGRGLGCKEWRREHKR